MEDFADEIINGQTFQIAINNALATTYRLNGKRCSARRNAGLGCKGTKLPCPKITALSKPRLDRLAPRRQGQE